MFEIKENKNCCDTKETQTKAIFITINLFLPPHQACGILIPHPGIQPVPPAFGLQSLNCRTAREVPQQIFLSVNVCVHIYTLIYVSHIYNISDQISRSVMCDSLRPQESQHARPPCPSPTPRVHWDSRPSSQWCHPAISSSVVPFSSCPQSLLASESFPLSQLFTWGGQSTGVSALANVFRYAFLHKMFQEFKIKVYYNVTFAKIKTP